MNNHKMYVAEHHPGTGPSAILLHGGNVAGSMWEEQVRALPDYHVLVPDLPGYGRSAAMTWSSLADVADQLAEVVQTRATGGRAHVVGLSLGGVLGTVFTARHPDLVRSALVTGAPLRGVHGVARRVGTLQLRIWDRRWYWTAQARALRLPADATETFVETGLAISRDNMTRVVREVYDGVQHAHLDRLNGCPVPILALAGGKDIPAARDSLVELTDRLPNAFARIVPGMHHAWNAEDPALFNDVLRTWLHDGTPSPALTTL